MEPDVNNQRHQRPKHSVVTQVRVNQPIFDSLRKDDQAFVQAIRHRTSVSSNKQLLQSASAAWDLRSGKLYYLFNNSAIARPIASPMSM